MAETTTKVDKQRKQARRPSISALMAATDDQRAAMTHIIDTFGKLPEPLRIIVASQIRKEIEA